MIEFIKHYWIAITLLLVALAFQCWHTQEITEDKIYEYQVEELEGEQLEAAIADTWNNEIIFVVPNLD